jgi:hypothetical protein
MNDLTVVPEFDQRVRRVQIDGQIYFSILDVFKYYTDTSDPSTAWKYVLEFLEKQGFEGDKKILSLQFPGRGQRKTPVASYETMLRISQATTFKNWEALRQWMATTGVERIQETLNPTIALERGREAQVEELIRAGMERRKAILCVTRRQIHMMRRLVMSETAQAGAVSLPAIHAAENLEVLGASKKEMIERRPDIDETGPWIYRDNFSEAVQQTYAVSELDMMSEMSDRPANSLSHDELIQLQAQSVRRVKPIYEQKSLEDGTDFLTGQSLLNQ